jgi:pimeloyl-ACP methyl ester carboxylesterase
MALFMRESIAVAELGACLMAVPLWPLGARGDGHPVLVLPGLLQSDISTLPLRMFLASRGYSVYGWGRGRNTGRADAIDRHLLKRVAELHARHGPKVSLVGWSMGGVFARVLAHELAGSVRQVITLGSPFAGNPKASNAWRLYELLSGQSADDCELSARFRAPPGVPTTSVYSKKDGIVAWRTCLNEPGPQAENIAVASSHCGMGFHPSVLFTIADRLAQPESEWRPSAARSRACGARRGGVEGGPARGGNRGESAGRASLAMRLSSARSLEA